MNKSFTLTFESLGRVTIPVSVSWLPERDVIRWLDKDQTYYTLDNQAPQKHRQQHIVPDRLKDRP